MNLVQALIKRTLETLPVIPESELRDRTKRFPAVHVARIKVNYPLSGIETKAGFVFGTNKDRTALYLSRDAVGDENNFCNLGEPFILTEYLTSYEILKPL